MPRHPYENRFLDKGTQTPKVALVLERLAIARKSGSQRLPLPVGATGSSGDGIPSARQASPSPRRSQPPAAKSIEHFRVDDVFADRLAIEGAQDVLGGL